jgi:hypothetical protein
MTADLFGGGTRRRFPHCAVVVATVWLSLAGVDVVGVQSVAPGTIHGSVKDETGGALPGVTATLTSPGLQVPQVTTVTDAQGDY